METPLPPADEGPATPASEPTPVHATEINTLSFSPIEAGSVLASNQSTSDLNNDSTHDPSHSESKSNEEGSVASTSQGSATDTEAIQNDGPTPPKSWEEQRQEAATGSESESAQKYQDTVYKKTFDQMMQMIRDREPDLLKKTGAPGSSSNSYWMGGLPYRANDPELRKDLTMLVVAGADTAGDLDGAVNYLQHLHAADLDLNKIEVEDYVKNLYSETVEARDPRAAHHIAELMRLYRDRVVKVYPEDPKDIEMGNWWKMREKVSFQMWAENALEKSDLEAQLSPEEIKALERIGKYTRNDINVADVIMYMGNRNDEYGFGSENSDELVRKVTERHIQNEIRKGRISVALKIADDAHMGQEYIDKLKGEVTPTIGQRLSQKVDSFKNWLKPSSPQAQPST